MSLRSSYLRCFIIVIIFAVSFASRSASNEADKMALLALRDEFIKGGSILTDSSNSLNSWNDSRHFCQWKGIICGKRHKRVTVVDLKEQKLAGILSHSIGNLTFLKGLYLTNNSLHGEIPKQIGKLWRLQWLVLRGNSFQGRIPSEIGNCSNLLELDISNNDLTGLVPSEFRSLSKVTWFMVGQNHLTGEIPTFLRNYSSLSFLSLTDNNFYGEIQDSFNGLSKLWYLSLLGNNFSGSISPLYNISSLQALSLGNNYFSGTLPPDIDTAFPNLYFISLFHNFFTGTIPPSLMNISGLSTIQLNNNKFTGRVPDYNLGKLKDLRTFILSDNQLGSDTSDGDLNFMEALTNCTKLENVVVSRNRLRGTLSSIVGNFTSGLERFLISSNYINGPIPEGLGELSRLIYLDLSGNQFNGTIPTSLGKLSNIGRLYLHGNILKGELPYSLGNLTHLLLLTLSSNSLRGVIPSALGKCKDMEVIYLGHNQFTGNLPDDLFSQFQNLRTCGLSHNSFNGTFPSLFGKLKALNILDASHNFFSGQIPSQLGESLSLEYLNLGGNSFNGSIPSSLGNLRGLTFLDLSSNNLSGNIPKEFASLVLVQNLNLSFNQLKGEVPMLENASVISVAGNSKLCGGNRELLLQKCIHGGPPRNSIFSRKLIILIISLTTVVAASVSLFVFLCIYFGYRRKHKRDNVDGDLSEDYRRVTYVELFKATQGFANSNLIGTGSFGDVYQGILDGDESKAVAVKVLKLSTTRGATKSFDSECKILTRIRHRNLLRIITSCSSLDDKGNDFKALVFDFMSNGNLDTWLHYFSDGILPLSLAKRLEIAIDVGCALDYLHNGCEIPIVHCDLKPSNILLDEDMVAHVGDFGLAKLLIHAASENLGPSESMSTIIKGSIGYVAPEYGMGATISTQGDIYSYGILLLELITGKRPTDEIFNNGTSLCSYIRSVTPGHVEEVIDQHLVKEFQEAISTQSNPEPFKLQYYNLLVSFVEIGIACSCESSTDRMDIQSALKCLKRIQKSYHIVCGI